VVDSSQLDALVAGRHRDPFAILGPHQSNGSRRVRCMQPNATAVSLINASGKLIADMEKIHDGGVFAGTLPPRLRRYALRVTFSDGAKLDVEDPYRFPPMLGEMDLYLLGEGSDQHIFRKLGAHLTCKLQVRSPGQRRQTVAIEVRPLRRLS